MDGRVLDINPVLRALLVNLIIVPFRSPRSAAVYRKIWTEQGSPLAVYGRRLEEMVRERLGQEYVVELSMRYQEPSVPLALEKLRRRQVRTLTVVPLFPQYASATVGSVHQEVMRIVSQWQTIPEIRLIREFFANPNVIKVFAENGRAHQPERFDHVLFSFHGIPERQLLASDDSGAHCLQSPDCCRTLGPRNSSCYSAQCHATAKLIAGQLGLSPDRYTVTFQSRLGRTPWTQPYTSEVVKALAEAGAKRVLVFSPAFVADCLETLYEIRIENREIFQQAGGQELVLVESLNDSPLWADALVDLIRR
jgi:ferrochelatase